MAGHAPIGAWPGVNGACAISVLATREGRSLAIHYCYYLYHGGQRERRNSTTAQRSRGHWYSGRYPSPRPCIVCDPEGNHVGIHGWFPDQAGDPTAPSTEPCTATVPNSWRWGSARKHLYDGSKGSTKVPSASVDRTLVGLQSF